MNPGEFVNVPANGRLIFDGTEATIHPKLPVFVAATHYKGPEVQEAYFEFPIKFNDSLHFDVLHYSTYGVKVNHIPLSKSRTKLRIPASRWKRLQKQREQNRRDAQMMRDLYQKHYDGPISHQCWSLPVNSKVVSRYASPRTLPSGNSYYHSGVDLRARTGTPIRAPASGKVIYSDHMVVPGNTVVIDHGGGVLSRYMHLNKFEVNQGSEVTRGQIIGLAGATGRVEAAHLHWEVVWKGKATDPFSFMDTWNKYCYM